MKKMIKTGIILMLSMALLLPVAGCGEETQGLEQSEETEDASTEPNRWLKYLRILPENETTLAGACIQTSDYTDILQGYYAEQPEEPILPVEQLAFNNLQLFNNRSYTDEEWKNTLGFTIDDVTATIIATAGPPSEYQAIYGTFTAEDIETAAKTGPLQEHLEIKSHAGFEYYSWGEDRAIHMDWRSNIRNLGRGHRLAYVDGFALWMIWTEGVESMIDAYAGNVPSLADKEDYQLLAAELEKTGVVTAFFSSEVLSLTEFIERTREHLTDVEGSAFEEQNPLGNEPLLKPFSSFVTGAGEDENGRYMVIILLNPDEKTAEDNVSLLEARINESEMFPHTTNPDMRNIKWTDDDAIESIEITSRGRFTIAKLYSEVIYRWKYFHYWGTIGPYVPLLLHE
ncbi:MAG: hypothetical protein A2158_00750 [Chloroflexi bacterium RBG_13_46_14]|nr:MAG: hypothetical protein A2158_00750 [Chloroflexi bacterium RBG_13_46_14]